jgi:hypothetical protein
VKFLFFQRKGHLSVSQGYPFQWTVKGLSLLGRAKERTKFLAEVRIPRIHYFDEPEYLFDEDTDPRPETSFICVYFPHPGCLDHGKRSEPVAGLMVLCCMVAGTAIGNHSRNQRTSSAWKTLSSNPSMGRIYGIASLYYLEFGIIITQNQLVRVTPPVEKRRPGDSSWLPRPARSGSDQIRSALSNGSALITH